jgi:hypothetical protein
MASKPRDGTRCYCPDCGGVLRQSDGTRRIGGVIRRFATCTACGEGWTTHQEPPRVVRKITRRKSASGQSPLKIAIA